MYAWKKTLGAFALSTLMFMPSFTALAEVNEKPVADAWTDLEGKQLGLAMGSLLDDAKQKELNEAAQKRYGLDEDGGERFMVCMMGLGGHPDFTVALVKEALAVCSRNMAPSR